MNHRYHPAACRVGTGCAHLTVALLLLLALLGPAHAARLALVIGNKDYTVGQLVNPINDAEDMAALLGGPLGLGFQVTLVKNLKRDDIGPTVENFFNRIRPGDDVLVFYAGHGLQVKGVNYLPAVDARIRVETDVPLNSLNLNELLQRLDEARAGVRLLLIDACRDNPYGRGFRSNARGLARVEGAPSGTLMHFATRPGGVASDGTGRNGVYTAELLKHLKTPGLAVESTLKRVASGVRLATGGSQQPWTEGALDGEFYFAPSIPPFAATPIQPANAPAAAPQSASTRADASVPGTIQIDANIAEFFRRRGISLPQDDPNSTSACCFRGLGVADLSDAELVSLKINGGVQVTKVDAESERAGLRLGDIVLSLDNFEVSSAASFAQKARTIDGSSRVTLMIRRGEWVNYVIVYGSARTQ